MGCFHVFIGPVIRGIFFYGIGRKSELQENGGSFCFRFAPKDKPEQTGRAPIPPQMVSLNGVRRGQEAFNAGGAISIDIITRGACTFDWHVYGEAARRQ